MAKFGFKFMQEPVVEIEEIEEVIKPEFGNCVYCKTITDLVVEHDSVVKLYVPICKNCFPKFKVKEKSVEKMTESIGVYILS